MESNLIRDQVFSVIRTWAPMAIGGLLSWLAVHSSFVADESTKAGLVVLLTFILQALYYLLVRLFETYISPKFSGFIGDFRKGATQPHYADPTKTTVIAPTDTPAPTIVTDVTPDPPVVEVPPT